MATTFQQLRLKLARLVAGSPKRAFAQGAIVDRLSADWRLSSASGNQETRADIRELRRRGRALFRDDPVVTGAVREFVNNVVGETGLRLHPRNKGADGKPAEKANAALIDAWKDWGHKETASVDRSMSFVDIQDRIVESLVVDGEVFIRKHSGFRNKYAYSLELIDPDLLDEQFNVETMPNGNQIWMGVEIDKWGAPVQYHFWTRHPAESGRRERVAIPADEIIHLFKRKRTKQVRGVSWLTPVIFRLKMLGAYEDAEVTAARIAASKMGFFETIPDAFAAFELPAPNEKIVMDVAPGSIDQAPPGYKFTPWDPQHPNAQFAAFLKAMLRTIAGGLGMAYTTLTGDLEGTNYSSIRAGLLNERDFWRRLHSWFAEHFHRLVFASWLEMAILTPILSLPSRLAERWTDVEWKGRGWKWVDPYNDARANEMMLALGLTSRQQLCAEMGREFEDIIDDLKRENEIADAAGVYIGGLAAKQDNPQPVDENGNQPAANGKDESQEKSIDEADLQRSELRMLHAISSHTKAPTINVSTPDVRVDMKAPDVKVDVNMPAPPAPAAKTTSRKILHIYDDNGVHKGYEIIESRTVVDSEATPETATNTKQVA
jgi:lambda family phage portal protein